MILPVYVTFIIQKINICIYFSDNFYGNIVGKQKQNIVN